MKDDGGPAFPCEESHGDAHEGMSLRDYFAAAALQGLYACDTLINADGSDAPELMTDEWLAQKAYEQADALLAERKAAGK